MTLEKSWAWPKNLPTTFFPVSLPIPIPAHECSVTPPIFTAAIPVDAVIPSEDDAEPPLNWMISRSKTDFPVPSLSN